MLECALSQYCAPTLDYACDYSKATALADISDALLIQGEQIAQASGVGLRLDAELFENSDEFSALQDLATEIKSDIWQWILGGGEDHVFLATGKDLPGLRIGEVIAGAGISGIAMKKAIINAVNKIQ